MNKTNNGRNREAEYYESIEKLEVLISENESRGHHQVAEEYKHRLNEVRYHLVKEK